MDRLSALANQASNRENLASFSCSLPACLSPPPALALGKGRAEWQGTFSLGLSMAGCKPKGMTSSLSGSDKSNLENFCIMQKKNPNYANFGVCSNHALFAAVIQTVIVIPLKVFILTPLTMSVCS